MSKKIEFENYIELNGERVLISALPQEKRTEIGEQIWDLMMEQAGFIFTETLINKVNERNTGHRIS